MAGEPQRSNVGYDGQCAVCGWIGYFDSEDDLEQPARRFRCGGCGAPVRFRDEAHIIVEEFGVGRHGDLDELVASGHLDEVSVYHVGHTGPVRQRLCRLPNYEESAADPTEAADADTDVSRSRQDLQALTFPDQCFDLVISNHVMEHVPDPWVAFGEIARVLRPGGLAITSVPVPGGLLEESRPRARLGPDGIVEHLEEARFHKSPEGEPSLVFTDFGADVVDRTHAVGLLTTIRRPHLQQRLARRNVVIVSRRLMVER